MPTDTSVICSNNLLKTNILASHDVLESACYNSHWTARWYRFLLDSGADGSSTMFFLRFHSSSAIAYEKGREGREFFFSCLIGIE